MYIAETSAVIQNWAKT